MKNERIWAFFTQFGNNMWADPIEKDGIHAFPQHIPDVYASDHMRFHHDIFVDMTEKLQVAGANMIVFDMGEGIRYESHPEISAVDAWSKEQFRAELDRLRGMGFEVIPKLNFSTCHDEWMGMMARMVSTPQYYRFCADMIDEVTELFDHPRFFHIGMDEEGIECQRKYNLAVIRQGELWWHDFHYIVDCVEKRGARAWMWADDVWHHKEDFLAKMSREVLMSNWYYGGFADPTRTEIAAYDLLDQHGFDQIPTGSTWGDEDNFPETVRYCESHLSREHTLGYLQVPWYPVTPERADRQYRSITQMGIATKLDIVRK